MKLGSFKEWLKKENMTVTANIANFARPIGMNLIRRRKYPRIDK